MSPKKSKRARQELTPQGEFTDIVEKFPEACRRPDRSCRNIVALGAGITLAERKGERGVISSPGFAVNNAMAELEVLAGLAR